MSSETISSLVKYCASATGIKILSDQSLRWSAPHLFGDPFELHYSSEIDVTARGILDRLLREALIMLFGPDAPTGRTNKLVNVLARWREEQRFCDEQEANTVLRELLGQIADLQARQVDEFMANWRSYARTVRINCFSEKPHLIGCWQRYADNHAGLALRFDCGEDTGLPAPKPVQYQAPGPVITSLGEQIATILGRGPAPDSSEFQHKLLWKGRQDLLEQEWRCFDNDRDDPASDESLWYSYRKFPAHELRGVYFGTRMLRTERELVAKLVRRNYPAAKLYQAKVRPGRFEIDFEPVSNR